MAETKDPFDGMQISKFIVKGIQEKKGSDIVLLNLKNIGNAIADYFVICTGTSDSQIDAITDSVEQMVFTSTQQNPWHKEGLKNKEWVLIDYVDVVVHIFNKGARDFYALEDLWGDASITNITEDF